MLNWVFISAFFLSAPASGNPGGGPQNGNPPAELERVILVDVDINTATDAPRAYSASFDKKRVEVQVEFDDPLNNLTDFVLEGDPIDGAECYVPEMKIIYSEYTYVISLYCAAVVKYKNSSPYTPSNVKVANDLEFTEDMLAYLRNMHKRYFGPYNPTIAAKVCTRPPMDEPVNDDPALGDDNDDDDISRDAIDKEGWFQVVPDDDGDLIGAEPTDE